MIVCLNTNHYVSVKENAMLKVTQQVGALAVEVAGESPKDVIEQLGFFGSLPAVCPFEVEGGPCGHPLQFTYKAFTPRQGQHAGKLLKYYGLRCSNVPAHECNFGVRTDGGALYYKGKESFEIEFEARKQFESGNHEGYDDNRQHPRDDFNQTDNDGHVQQQAAQPEHGGPTAGQRTLMSKLLGDLGMNIEQARTATGATLKWEEMNPGQAARFIDAVKNLKKEVAF